MFRLKKILFTIFMVSLTYFNAVAQRTEILLDEGWKFSKGNFPNAAEATFNDTRWETVTVPHDWAISGPFDKEIDKQVTAITQNNETKASEKTGRTGSLPYIGEAWYRKKLSLPTLKSNQKVLLQIDGAMSEPRVYLNGKLVGQWNYGYNYFYIDITNDLKATDNVLAIHLKNMPKSSRWYPGAGLYRNVHLIIKEEKSIDQWGITITTPIVKKEFAKVNVKTKLSGKGLRLVTQILDSLGKQVAIDTAKNSFGNEDRSEYRNQQS
jgi:beta-galactosidase